MTAAQRVIVIMDNGRVIGTQILQENEPSGAGITARLRAGPAQTQHEIRAVVPANLADPRERERFHASLAEQIAAKK